jgi:APA family basic amino acid/polyamine antiporter
MDRLSLGATGIRVAAALALIVLTAVNAVGVRAGTWTNNALMTAKVIGMLALIALAFGRGAPPASHFDVSPATVFGHASLSLLLTALVPILFAYGGWQSCANIAAEIKDPARNLAKANVLGVIVVVVLYLSLNLAYLWVLTPAQIAASPALAADVARAAAGEAGALRRAADRRSSLGFRSGDPVGAAPLLRDGRRRPLLSRCVAAASAVPHAGVRALVSSCGLARAVDDQHV